jgi:ketosteroid isomerase-like protein
LESVVAEVSRDDVAAVRRAVDRLLEGEVGPLLALLTTDVGFEVAGAGDGAGSTIGWGKQAVADYFTALGGLKAFWQLDYTGTGEQVIAWGTESFTLEGCELQGACEFALLFEVAFGRITHVTVIEDLRAYLERKTLESGPTDEAAGPTGEDPRPEAWVEWDDALRDVRFTSTPGLDPAAAG